MLNKIKNRKQEGFTIIEVLIVLAIAGLIMLIVFLAVPALQRNSRNSQRTNDASRISAAVTECLNNNNGKVASCNSLTGAKVNSYITMTDNQQLVNTTAALDGALLNYGQKCSADGTTSGAGGGSRSFTLTYLVETSGTGTAPRCLGS